MADCDSGASLRTLTHLRAGRKHAAVLSVWPKTAGQALTASANSKMGCQYKMVFGPREKAFYSWCRHVKMAQALGQDTLEVLIMVWHLCFSGAAPRKQGSCQLGNRPHPTPQFRQGREFKVQAHSWL